MKHKSNSITLLLQTAQCCLCSGSNHVSPNLSSLLPSSSLTGTYFRSLEPMGLFLSLGQCTMSFIHWKCSFYSPPWTFILSHCLLWCQCHSDPASHSSLISCTLKKMLGKIIFSFQFLLPASFNSLHSNRTKIKEALFCITLYLKARIVSTS